MCVVVVVVVVLVVVVLDAVVHIGCMSTPVEDDVPSRPQKI